MWRQVCECIISDHTFNLNHLWETYFRENNVITSAQVTYLFFNWLNFTFYLLWFYWKENVTVQSRSCNFMTPSPSPPLMRQSNHNRLSEDRRVEPSTETGCGPETRKSVVVPWGLNSVEWAQCYSYQRLPVTVTHLSFSLSSVFPKYSRLLLDF